MNKAQIALTPCQRLVPAAPLPFTIHQHVTQNDPFTDFQQAAHDARRMGWLLQTSGAPPNHTRLVLPTQWHEVYLKALLRPPELLGKVNDMTIDGFLEQTIRKFRSSTLRHCLDREGVLREKVYDMEFLRAAQEVVGDPHFLLPQFRTPQGDGIVDFVSFTKSWAFELLCEGIGVKEHAGRFETGGKYAKALPAWEWRVIDFRHAVQPRQDRGKPPS